ncbi:DNA helicase RecQ [Salibacterium halotolerans]|uniref:DNA helicase RecQ n=1 Tax=Salibacterium halotolerans TaxID=1884432 RepID=A0A1I5RNK9_9BACI|nr:DNA helicase RecQ [Salibacterium halotolerans]SFP60129.1 ATP-dependent DNA helicase RecQ [Salibacterium halotolerans]
MLDEAKEKLQHHFGYETFLNGQENILHHVMQRQSVLGIMPTGGGKSVCYQIPSLLLPGITIVISPLISLMKDQVDEAREAGIPATFINSSVSHGEMRERMEALRRGECRLLYVAPERLSNQEFLYQLQSIPVSLTAVDEAHCLSQWGHDFRPAYLEIPRFLSFTGSSAAVLALTATATPQVAEDISHALDIPEDQVVKTGFARENLTFSVVKGQNREAYIVDYVKKRKNQPGIIYANTRKEVEKLWEMLHKEGLSVEKYHGGMETAEREAAQERFVYDDVTVMAATTAFGMGINKSNVRYVLHARTPRNIESYYQEAGRAGRDGAPGDCTLLFSPQDAGTHQFLIDQSQLEEDRKDKEYRKLRQMIHYCHTEDCLQNEMLRYFGEEPQEPCGRCLNCTDDRTLEDVTEEAQMVFSCVKRMRERFGKVMTAQVLAGSSNEKIRTLKLHTLTTYGLMKNRTQKDVAAFIDFLAAHAYLSLSDGAYPVLRLTNAALDVLRGEARVMRKETLTAETVSTEDPLFEEMRQLRLQLAKQHGVAPYMVFSDKTLKEFCRYLPQQESEMMEIKGVGRQKLDTYGGAFLDVLQRAAVGEVKS